MKKLAKFLKGKKTYILAGAAILYSVLGVLTHNLDLSEAIRIVLEALGGAAIRHSIE